MTFSLLHIVQIYSGAHPASYTVGTVGSFPWIKGPEREAEHSPQSSAECLKQTGVLNFLGVLKLKLKCNHVSNL
jgi:hypothetical protein